jgi:hypothetical protein
MPKRQRIDSPSAAVAVHQSATRTIQPPDYVPLDECDLPFFRSIIAERAIATWTAHAIEYAALLARAMGQLEQEQRAFRGENSVFVSDKGGMSANPRVQIIHGLQSQIKQGRQSLGIHDRGLNGEARDSKKRQGMGRAIEDDARSAADDDLMNMRH